MGLFRSKDVLEVTLVVMGDVSRDRCEITRDAIETHFMATVEIEGRLLPDDRFIPDPEREAGLTFRERAYDETRDQYDSEAFVSSTGPPEVTPLLWLTDLDLYQGSLESKSYVFGVAAIGDRISAVSTAHLADGEQWTSTATERLRKQVIKQFGRSLGAERCQSEGCVMTPSYVPADLDRPAEYICPDCAAAIGESLLR